MTRTRSLLLAGALLLSASPLAAQTQVKLTGAGNTVAYGVYVGPYKGQLGSGPGAPTVDLFCVDYMNHSHIGQIWNANKSQIGMQSGASISSTRYGATANALEKYRMAAWLTTQFATAPTTQWGDIHATIWHLMTPTAPNVTPSGTWLAAAQTFYLTNSNPHYYDQFQILSDVNMSAANQAGIRTNGVQEFIVVTPEPGTMLLLGTGMVGLLLVGYKRLA
ncbi:MAG: PEP-CTERM sorting domain-containing protein [Gemmatimonadota bacterium]